MITVIIAGGSGSRLWPLSTPSYPKHLLNIIDYEKTLLQNTYDRAAFVGDAVYVLTEASHAGHVQEQLPELKEDAFVIEPARRGTASCIVAALTHLEGKVDPDEPIAVMAADHYIRDNEGFKHSFKIAGDVSRQEGRIVLVGVEPDHPATGFGYIQKDGVFDEERFVYNVHSFTEKPAFAMAKKYVKSGNYLWNCGYFVGSINTFKKNMREHAPVLFENYESLIKVRGTEEYEKIYLTFENNAIDFALIEHVDDLLVIPATFDWLDLGSYSDLHKAVENDEVGNHVYGESVEIEGVENSFIQNHTDKPLAVIGLDNVVVVNTKAGILVARKDLAQQVGEVSKRFKHPGTAK